MHVDYLGDDHGEFGSLRRKLLDAANNLVEWTEIFVESAEAQVAEVRKDDAKFNFKNFCIICGKASMLEIQELSFCSAKCGSIAADRMKRASGCKK